MSKSFLSRFVSTCAAGPPSLASGSAERPVQVVLTDVQGAARTRTDVSRRFVPASCVSWKRSATRSASDLVTRPTSTYFGARSFADPTAWDQLPADVRAVGVGQLF